LLFFRSNMFEGTTLANFLKPLNNFEGVVSLMGK
jgi:hypothetical protein